MNIASPPIKYLFLTKEKVEDVQVEIVHELMLEEKSIYFLSFLQWRAERHMFRPHT